MVVRGYGKERREEGMLWEYSDGGRCGCERVWEGAERGGYVVGV